MPKDMPPLPLPEDEEDDPRTVELSSFVAPGPQPGQPGATFGGAPTGSTFGGAPTGSTFGGSTFGGAPTGSTFGSSPFASGVTPSSGSSHGSGFSPPSSGISPSRSRGGQAPLDRARLGLDGRRYEIGAQLDRDYWEAVDRHIRRRVVLRVTETGPDGDAPPGFWRHAQLLAQLDHASVVQVHDVGSFDGRALFSVDRIEGETLQAIVERDVEQRPTLPVLLRAYLDACAAIEHAHAHGIVHARLDPRRVWLGAFGQVWVNGWDGAWVMPDAPAEVRRAAGRGAPPLDRSNPDLAPELHAGRDPEPACDVYGLGLLLHWILVQGPPGPDGPELRGGAQVPRELAAVAGKALADDPDDRYDHASDLMEDVRRFLDGKSVLAARDSFLQACGRIRRRYPLASALGALVLLLIVTGALVTYALVDSRIRRARAEQTAAAERAAEAQAAEALALKTRQAAERRAASTAAVKQIELTLARALAGGADSERLFRTASELLARTFPEGHDPELRNLIAARLHAARGEFYLNRARPPRPDLALRELEALTRLRPGDAEAHQLVFLAARRLPGRAAERAELRALDAMARSTGPFSVLGKLQLKVRAMEREALLLARLKPPRQLPWAGKQKDPVYKELLRFARERWDVAVAHELMGRFICAVSLPGFHRRVKAFDPIQKRMVGSRSSFHQAFGDFYNAINLDPLDPEPRMSYQQVYNVKYGLHSPWRWKGGWALSALARACRFARRPEPLLVLAEELHKLGREESTIPLLERALAMPRSQEPRSGPDPRVRARLLLARAQLMAGRPPAPGLSDLEVPAPLRGRHLALRGWEALVRGQTRAGVQSLFQSLRAMEAADSIHIRDFLNALCDARAKAREVIQLLSPQIPPPGRPAPYLASLMMLARATQLSRLGANAQQDLTRLARQRWSGVGWEAGLTSLARARMLARGQPRNPMGHVLALLTWAEMNVDVASREALAPRAQTIIVERLRKLGRRQAAQRFAELERPVEELSIRRQYVAPEVWHWRGAPERRP